MWLSGTTKDSSVTLPLVVWHGNRFLSAQTHNFNNPLPTTQLMYYMLLKILLNALGKKGRNLFILYVKTLGPGRGHSILVSEKKHNFFSLLLLFFFFFWHNLMKNLCCPGIHYIIKAASNSWQSSCLSCFLGYWDYECKLRISSTVSDRYHVQSETKVEGGLIFNFSNKTIGQQSGSGGTHL